MLPHLLGDLPSFLHPSSQQHLKQKEFKLLVVILCTNITKSKEILGAKVFFWGNSDIEYKHFSFYEKKNINISLINKSLNMGSLLVED